MAARARSMSLWRADERALADGQVAWSWPPDAEVKLALLLMHGVDDGGQRAGAPGRSRSSRKPVAQGMPDCRLNLWYLPPAFFQQAGHG